MLFIFLHPNTTHTIHYTLHYITIRMEHMLTTFSRLIQKQQFYPERRKRKKKIKKMTKRRTEKDINSSDRIVSKTCNRCLLKILF